MDQNKRTSNIRRPKRVFKCSWPLCPTRMYLYHISADKITMMDNQADHIHDINAQKRGIILPIKNKIDELFTMGVDKPLNVLYVLRKSFPLDAVPTQTKIASYLAVLRRRLYGGIRLSFNEFDKFCTENSALLSDIDLPFVIS